METVSRRAALRAFTFIEVMIATAVLGVTSAFVFEAFSACMRNYRYAASSIRVMPQLDETVWKARDELSRTGAITTIPRQGTFDAGGILGTFTVSSDPRGCAPNGACIYALAVSFAWQAGPRSVSLNRIVYVRYVSAS